MKRHHRLTIALLSAFFLICGRAATQTISVSPNPACKGDTLILDMSGYSNNGFDFWLDGAAQVQNTDFTITGDTILYPIKQVLSFGSHTLVVQCCGGTNADTTTFTLNAQTEATFTGYGTLCEGTGFQSAQGVMNPGQGVWSTSVGSATSPAYYGQSTGQIQTNNSGWPLGIPFDMTYTTSSATCPDTFTLSVTIFPLDDAVFSYGPGSPATFCRNDSTHLVLIDTPTTPGVFSFSSPNIYLQDTLLGLINLDSTIGSNTTITATYATGGTCPDTTSQDIRIRDYRSAFFEYPTYSFCKPYPGNGKEDPINLPPGTSNVDTWSWSGGTPTAPAVTPGLDLKTSDGELDINDNATHYGTNYIVTRTTSANTNSPFQCGDVYSVVINIVKQDTPVFNYLDSVLCPNDAPVMPNIISGAGTPTFSSATLNSSNLDPLSGQVTPTGAPVGNHAIRMTIAGSCGGDTLNYVTINPTDNASFTLPYTRFCTNDLFSPPAIKTPSTDTGYFYNAILGASVDSVTGEIDLACCGWLGSFDLSYITVDSCPDTFSIPIEIFTDTTTFHYPDTSYCQFDIQDPSPVIFGSGGGVFRDTSGTLTIDSVSGIIDLGTATPGIYSIQYNTPNTQGACPRTVYFDVEILQKDDPNFMYGQPSYCYGDSIGTVTMRADSSGHFREATGTLTIDSLTGEIDVQNNTPGIYLIYHVTDSTCPDSSFQIVEIFPREIGDFQYPRTSYCQTDQEARPVLFGTGGGFFYCNDTSLALDSITGEITPANSQTGTYAVNYNTNGACPVVFTDSITIELAGNTNWEFPGLQDEFCESDTNIVPVLDSLAANNGFWYSSNPTLAVVDSVNGTLFISQSQPGTYTMTYQLYASSSNCISRTTNTFSIDSATADAYFVYPDTAYCQERNRIIDPVLTGQSGGNYYISANDSLIFTNPSTVGNQIRSSDGKIDIFATPPGSYTVYYTIPGVCSNDTSFTLTIYGLDTAFLDYGQTVYCQDEDDPYPNIGGTVGTFSASPDSVVYIAQTQFPGHIDLGRTPIGTYTISYVTIGNCPDSLTQNITINPVPAPTLVTDAAGSEICEGDSMEYEALGVNIINNTFTFLRNDTTVITIQNSDNNYMDTAMSDGDKISVIVENPDGCRDTSEVFVTVHPIPDGFISRADTVISSDVPMEVDLTADVPQTFFHWSMYGNGDMDPDSVVAQVIGPADSGVVVTIFQSITLGSDFYPVSVTFYVQPEAFGCWGAMDSVTINVNPNDEDIFVPGILTPNGDGLNDTWEIQVRTGVDPNRYVMLVLNRSGGVAHTMTPLNNGWAGGDLPEGVYWYVLKRKDTDEILKRGGLTIRRR